MGVISIQSQVAFGHVGNSAAVFPMQMHGIDVTAVPTTLLSNRPGYPSIRGRVLEPQLVADLLRGVEERGAVDTCETILSGYLGSPEIAAVVADFVARAKNPQPEAHLLLRSRVRRSRPGACSFRPASPRWCATGCARWPASSRSNHFEFEWLCGAKATTSGQVIGEAQALMARGPSTVVVTSAELKDTPDGEIETVAIEKSGEGIKAWRAGTPETADQPVRHRRSVCRAPGGRARSGVEHAGCAGACRIRHLRRAGAHCQQRDRGNADRRERRVCSSARHAGSTPSLSAFESWHVARSRSS